MHENFGVILGAVSAFGGAMTGIACVSWWLASRFNEMRMQLADHETKDVERFNALKLDIADVKMQSQIASTLLPKQ